MEPFQAKINTSSTDETLIYLRYLTARQITLDALSGGPPKGVDANTLISLAKTFQAAEHAAIKELLK